MTLQLSYIKIRHNFDDNYAISLVDPESFIPCAESHSISATERSRSIVLHDKQAIEVQFTDTSSRIGFQWSFDWEGDQYRWYVKGTLSLHVFTETTRWSHA
ncbi:hypothetical protein K492DRAFT_159547 [Lichtheimia hyalospora FSU 10163]|nr:hypothetical protein K492DRAFT_159547 [Lichtheimia hyalospora FSU 10163]